MYGQNEGPSTINIPKRIIPAETIITCQGCKYYKHQLRKSGRDPIYADDCIHPDISKDHPLGMFLGNLDDIDKNGIILTPDWCPYLKPKENSI